MICCSEFLKAKMDTNPLFARKTVAMHNFVDRVEWKEVEKKDYALYFGRFSKEKGIDTLLKVCRELPDVQFIFAGTGPLENEINGIPNIKNVGFQTGEALETLIREARFSIYPSEWYENCPFSVMESQMYGTPVLGANIGGIPELIELGKTGELFESGNATELKGKIQKLWSDKKLTDTYSRNCKDICFDDIEAYTKKLMQIYKGKKKSADSKKIIKVAEKGEKAMGKKNSGEKKLNGTVIVTYRCNARCSMCNRYKAPSKPEEEISIETIRKLPRMYFTNIVS